MKKLLLSAALCALSTPAFAQVYTTSVTVPYDATAPVLGDGRAFAFASNNSSYTIRTGIDATNFYVDLTSTPNSNTDQSLQFANVYIGGKNMSTNVIFEINANNPNATVTSTMNTSAHYSLAGTGFSFTATPNDIAFIVPVSFFETDPAGVGFAKQTVGDQLRVNYTQAFGYSLASGSPIDATNRLGSQNIQAADVPEPASWAMFIGGFGLVGSAVRRSRRKMAFA